MCSNPVGEIQKRPENPIRVFELKIIATLQVTPLCPRLPKKCPLAEVVDHSKDQNRTPNAIHSKSRPRSVKKSIE